MRRRGNNPHHRAAACSALLLACLLSASAAPANRDPRVAIERAVRQIELGDYALARSLLDTPLIDAEITPTERSRAYYLHGYSLEQQGFYVSAAQNYAKALAFNAENPATLAALGHLYARGLGVPRDRVRASELLRSAAALGHAPGMTNLGALLLAGLSSSATPEQDLQEARSWLTSAAAMPAQASDGKAQLFLAQSYRRPYAKNPEPQRALEYYQQALVLNQAAAYNAIGNMHLQGELGVVDLNAAVAAFEAGSRLGDAASQTSLGYLLMTGRAGVTDQTRAAALFSAAANSNDARAHNYLGYLSEVAPQALKEEAEEEEAEERAITHYQRAAHLGYLPAIDRLAELMLTRGDTAAGVRYLQQIIDLLAQNDADGAAAQQLAARSNQLAWILATASDAAIRHGAAAVENANRAVAYNRSAATLDTLAAAYAETANFPLAIATQQQALGLLRDDQDAAQNPIQTEAQTEAQSQAQIDDYRARLRAYELSEPWREG